MICIFRQFYGALQIVTEVSMDHAYIIMFFLDF